MGKSVAEEVAGAYQSHEDDMADVFAVLDGSDDADTLERVASYIGVDVDDVDDDAVHTFLAEYPLEIVHEVGQPFTVVLGTGGPHVEIEGRVRDGGLVSAEFAIYWGTDSRVTRLDSSDALWRLAEYYLGYYAE
jgi:hypothetical protein